jgi:hypothetical protein
MTALHRLSPAVVALIVMGCGSRVEAGGADPDSGVTGSGVTEADTGTASSVPDAADVSVDGGVTSVTACFPSDPPFITPREPAMTKSEACAAEGAKKSTFASEEELLSVLVGSWVPCGPSPSWFLSHPGFVFGGDRTFRFLVDDGGALTPGEVVGRVRLIASPGGSFQVNVERDGGLTNILFVTAVGTGDRVDVSETGGEATLARIAPGAAATPTTYVDTGKCSLQGIWDLHSGPDADKASFSFDGKGHFVAGPTGTDICAGPTMTGTYRLTGDAFTIVSSTGMGCVSTLDSGWSVQFLDDCKRAVFSQTYDNCTGGRHTFTADTVLTKR